MKIRTYVLSKQVVNDIIENLSTRRVLYVYLKSMDEESFNKLKKELIEITEKRIIKNLNKQIKQQQK